MKINIHEIFESIQGEGKYVGHPALFIRLSGCPVNCSWCDTDNSKTTQVLTLDEIVDVIHASKMPIVVFTGGEPFAQPNFYNLLEHVIASKKISDKFFHVETSAMTSLQWNNLKAIHEKSVISRNLFSYRDRLFITFSPKLYLISKEKVLEELQPILSYLSAYSGQLKLVYDHKALTLEKLKLISAKAAAIKKDFPKYIQFEESLVENGEANFLLSEFLSQPWFLENFIISARLHKYLQAR